MRADIRKRLEQIESTSVDHIAKLDVIDYGVLDDYSGDEWQEIYFDETVTVVRHKESAEIRGYYHDRRSDDEKLAAGGLLEFM